MNKETKIILISAIFFFSLYIIGTMIYGYGQEDGKCKYICYHQSKVVITYEENKECQMDCKDVSDFDDAEAFENKWEGELIKKFKMKLTGGISDE